MESTVDGVVRARRQQLNSSYLQAQLTTRLICFRTRSLSLLLLVHAATQAQRRHFHCLFRHTVAGAFVVGWFGCVFLCHRLFNLLVRCCSVPWISCIIIIDLEEKQALPVLIQRPLHVLKKKIRASGSEDPNRPALSLYVFSPKTL